MLRCISRLGQRGVLGALFVVSMLGFASTAFAQFERGTISGTIKDAPGGVVPGVTVTATNEQTQTRRGRHRRVRLLHLPEPPAGRYTVSAELKASRRSFARTCSSTPPARINVDFAL